MPIYKVKVKHWPPYYDVTIDDTHYCRTDTLKEALIEAEQLQKLLLAIYDNALVVPIEIELD